MELVADGGFFEAPGAELTPAGDGAGEDAVFQAVFGGVLAAFAGDGAFGFSSVAAGDIGSGFGIF